MGGEGSSLTAVSTFAEILQSVLRETEPVAAVDAAAAAGSFESVLRSFGNEVAEITARCAPCDADGDEPVRDITLGVDLPRTMAEVKRAFRRMVLETHPDRPGGSHEAFLRTKALFDQACVDLARANAAPAPAPAVETGTRWWTATNARRAPRGAVAAYA